MRRIALAFVVVPALLLTLVACASAPVGDPPNWIPMEEASANAKQSGKKILVDVYTDWCGYCKQLDREVYARDDVKAYLDAHFEVVKLDAESFAHVQFQGKTFTKAELASAFRVTGYPATVFLDEESRYVTLLPGYHDAEAFKVVLRYIAEEHYTTVPFETYFAEHTR